MRITDLERSLRRRFRVVDTGLDVGNRELTLMHPADPEALIDEDAFDRDERLPYWADLWPSARILGEHVLGMRGEGSRLLELGCGCGLVACCASLSGFGVTATDYYEDALLFTRVNVWNNSRVEPSTRMVDWRDLPDDLGTFDLVVASDVLYERPYAALMADVILATLAPDGTAWVADPGRVAAPEFLLELRRRGLAASVAHRVPFADGHVRQTIDLIEISYSRPS